MAFIITPVSALTEKQANWFKLMEEEYLGKGRSIDQDGVYPGQCVDLVNNYVSYIFPFGGHKKDYSRTIGFGSGGELYYGAKDSYFEKIPYSEGVIPKSGDIVAWGGGGRTGSRGHVAVVYYADSNGMVLIHQNGSASRIVFQEHTDYHRIEAWSGRLLGFLRPKYDKLKVHDANFNDKIYNVILEGWNQPKRVLDNHEYNTLQDLHLISPSKSNKPSDILNRLQATVLVLRLTGNEEIAINMTDYEVEEGLNTLSDVEEIPDWAKKHVAYAINNKIISGVSTTEDGKIVFSPKGTIKGNQFATLIYRTLGYNIVSTDEVAMLYRNMFENRNNVIVNESIDKLILEDIQKNSEEFGVKLLNKRKISRNDASKIMYDMLVNAFYIDEEGKKTISLASRLLEQRVFKEEDLKAVLSK